MRDWGLVGVQGWEEKRQTRMEAGDLAKGEVEKDRRERALEEGKSWLSHGGHRSDRCSRWRAGAEAGRNPRQLPALLRQAGSRKNGGEPSPNKRTSEDRGPEDKFPSGMVFLSAKGAAERKV